MVLNPAEPFQERVNQRHRRVAINAIFPHITLPTTQIRRRHFPQAAVAFKPCAKAYHKHSIALLQPLLGLHVAQHVPQAAGRCVPKSVKGHSGWLQIMLRQPQALSNPIYHCLSSRVQAEMLRRCSEVRPLRLPRASGGEFVDYFG